MLSFGRVFILGVFFVIFIFSLIYLLDTYEGRNDPYSHGYYGPEVSYQSLAFLIQFQLLAVLSNFVFVHIAVWCISTLLQEWSSIWRWLLLLGALRFGNANFLAPFGLVW